MTAPIRRRWFRFAFSLRALFAIIAFAGIVIGWRLDNLRHAARIDELEGQLARLKPNADARVWRELQSITDLEMHGASLELAIEQIETLHKIKIALDIAAIDEATDANESWTVPPEPVDIIYTGPLTGAFHQLLQPHGLTYIVKNGKVLITTPAAIVNRTAQESAGVPAAERNSLPR